MQICGSLSPPPQSWNGIRLFGLLDLITYDRILSVLSFFFEEGSPKIHNFPNLKFFPNVGIRGIGKKIQFFLNSKTSKSSLGRGEEVKKLWTFFIFWELFFRRFLYLHSLNQNQIKLNLATPKLNCDLSQLCLLSI